MARKYTCRTASPLSIDESLKARMFALLDSHFHNVSWSCFCNDLSRKTIVFLLEDCDSGELVGFSTQQVLMSELGEQVVFSGDTIIDPSAWGSLAFPEAWGRWMLSLLDARPTSPLYWLLISKGHRTYRFLPTFFLDYAPASFRSYSASEVTLIRDVGERLFGKKLVQSDAGYLLVKHDDESQRLREHLLDLRHEETSHPHVEFFRSVNPDCDQGCELICLLRFCPTNMRPFCRRILNLSYSQDTELKDVA